MPNFGPVHTLIVHKVGGSYGPHSTEEFEDFEIVHPPECDKHTDEIYGDHYVCGVGENIQAAGVRFQLHYAGTPITEPGTYRIQAWSETYRGFDYTEYDGGIALCPAEEAT